MQNTIGDGEVRQGSMLATVSDSQIAKTYIARTEDMIARREQRRVAEVRPSVARKLSVTASSLDLIRRGRRKIIPAWLKTKIVALFIETAQAELRAIEYEIEVARQIGLDPRDGALVAARTRAAALISILEGPIE
jgi:hypothetical protein